MLNPYREFYVLPPIKVPTKKHPREIIKKAEEAIKHFSHNCPEGISVSGMNIIGGWLGKQRRYTYISHTSHYVLSGEVKPCCEEHRQALRDLQELCGWWWRYKAKRKLNGHKLVYGLISREQEFVVLLRPNGSLDDELTTINPIK